MGTPALIAAPHPIEKDKYRFVHCGFDAFIYDGVGLSLLGLWKDIKDVNKLIENYTYISSLPRESMEIDPNDVDEDDLRDLENDKQYSMPLKEFKKIDAYDMDADYLYYYDPEIKGWKVKGPEMTGFKTLTPELIKWATKKGL